LHDLGRAVEPGGRDGWLGFLAAGGTWEQLEAAVVSSPEFVNARGGDVDAVLDGMYRAVLGRPIEDQARAGYRDALARGATLGQVALVITTSPEHRQDQVRGWYQRFLQRTPAEDVSGWVNQLLAGVRDEQVLAAILGDDGREYYN